ncbi:hypothetical protein AMJ85_04355 [candidate division BRC1 bacterium SM23_51]|nr:MAG: hypothetical protein AMJ85_04355 [candidate division BRC1 bacterium SM23_51]
MVFLTESQDQADGIEKPKQRSVGPHRAAVLTLRANEPEAKNQIVSAARESDRDGKGSWRPRRQTQGPRGRGARPPHRIQQG